MSAKSIGLKSVISVDNTKDYQYPSIQVSDDNQIIQVRDNNYDSQSDLQTEVDALEVDVATLNTDSQLLLTNVLLLKSTLDDVIVDVAAIDTNESDINDLLDTISQKLNSGDYESWTSYYDAINAKDAGVFNTPTPADGENYTSYYFQPNLGDSGDSAYDIVKYFPSITYSLPTDTDSVPMLLQWNVKLTWWDSASAASAEHIKATGMLGIYLTSQDESIIYYQTKDGNFNFDADDDDNTIVVGCGSSVVNMPTGNQQVKLGFFVSSHNQDSSDYPIKSVTSWIVNITEQNYNLYSLMRV